MAKKSLRRAGLNQKIRVKAALSLIKNDDRWDSLKELASDKGFRDEIAYHKSTNPMVGVGTKNSFPEILHDFPFGLFEEKRIESEIQLIEQENKSYKIYLLSDVEANKVDMFKSYDEFKEHISAPDFKI